jgi:CBS domain-containing protein
MWRNEIDRPDDPLTRERETQRLARDEYERPRYGAPAFEGSSAGQWHDSSEAHHAGRHISAPPLHAIRAHEIMTQRIATVHPATPVERAARIMAEADCGALPVTGENGVLVGLVTDRDIALRIVARGRDARHAIVADCMTERVFACHAGESLADCMDQMARHQVRRLPIVDDHGRVVGVVAQSDLARHAARHEGHGERREVARVVGEISAPSRAPYR